MSRPLLTEQELRAMSLEEFMIYIFGQGNEDLRSQLVEKLRTESQARSYIYILERLTKAEQERFDEITGTGKWGHIQTFLMLRGMEMQQIISDAGLEVKKGALRHWNLDLPCEPGQEKG